LGFILLQPLENEVIFAVVSIIESFIIYGNLFTRNKILHICITSTISGLRERENLLGLLEKIIYITLSQYYQKILTTLRAVLVLATTNHITWPLYVNWLISQY